MGKVEVLTQDQVNEIEVAQQTDIQDEVMVIQDKYVNSGKKIYRVDCEMSIDDSQKVINSFFFKKPNVASYDRYVTTTQNSPTKALRVFVLDNVVEEQKELLEQTIEEYPAFPLNVGEKLLSILGLAKNVEIKKL